MKFDLATLGLGLAMAGTVAAGGGDVIIDFPGLLRPRANNNNNNNGGGSNSEKAVAAASSANLLAFSSALGGAAAEPVTSTGDSTRPFAVGSDTFTDFATAATRSCNNQHNACAGVAHSSSANGLTVGQCDTQQTSCEAAVASGPSSSSNSGTTAASVSASAAAQTSAFSISISSVSIASASVAAASTSTTSAFAVQGTLHSSDDNFLFFCG